MSSIESVFTGTNSSILLTNEDEAKRKLRDEIRAQGSMLAYSYVYKSLVSEIVPNYSELTNVEKLVFLQNSDTPELRDREKAMIDHIKLEKIQEEMSQVDTEAVAALALVRAGKSFDFYDKQSFPNLQKYCAIRPVEKYIKIEEKTKEEIHRLLLHHSSFGDGIIIECIEHNFQEMFTWGCGGGATTCRLIDETQCLNLPPLESLIYDQKL